MKHSRSFVCPNFEQSRPVLVYEKLAKKAHQDHIMRVSFGTKSVAVVIDTMCS